MNVWWMDSNSTFPNGESTVSCFWFTHTLNTDGNEHIYKDAAFNVYFEAEVIFDAGW